MSYCLLLQGADGSLRLLADSSFASRPEALAALAAQAESGAVDSAADQVWLIDLDSLAPVVLVARAAARDMQAELTASIDTQAYEAEPSEGFITEAPAVEPVEPAWAAAAGLVPEDIAAEGAEHLDAFAVEEPAVAETASEEPGSDEPTRDEQAADDSGLEAGLPVPGAVFEPDAAFAPSAEPLQDASSAPEGEEASSAAVVSPDVASILDDLVLPEPDLAPQPVEEDSFSDLREALDRSAAQMAAEGVVVPLVAVVPEVMETPDAVESLDIECAAVEEPVSPSVESAVVEDVPADDEQTTLGVTEVAFADAEPTADEEPQDELPEGGVPAEVAGWPWAESLPVIEADAALVPDATGDAASEPMSVTSASEIDLTFVGSGEDYSSLPAPNPLPGQEDPVDTLAPTLEVVPPFASEVEPPAQVSSDDIAPVLETGEHVAERVVVAETAEDDVLAPPSEADLIPEPSAFVSDVVAPTTVETPGYTPGSHDVSDMTCGDCVWVDTCPNKDQRDPASCGSFQWK